MNEEKIKVVFFDGEPIVYRDDNRLNEKEIVDLLVEYFEDCDALIKENEGLKEENDFLEIENESLEDGATKYAELYHKSLKENEQLKQKVNFYKDFQKDARELEKENGQLKSYTGEMEDYLARLEEKNEELKKENLDLSEELDYYKTKCASLENGLLQLRDDVDD